MNERLNILRGVQLKDGKLTTDPILLQQYDFLQTYWNFAELYSGRVLAIIEETIVLSFTEFGETYAQYTLVIFLCFLGFELFSLFVLRGQLMDRMRDDILESRGILNLIPNHAIENNKQVVENIIKKLKN